MKSILSEFSQYLDAINHSRDFKLKTLNDLKSVLGRNSINGVFTYTLNDKIYSGLTSDYNLDIYNFFSINSTDDVEVIEKSFNDIRDNYELLIRNPDYNDYFFYMIVAYIHGDNKSIPVYAIGAMSNTVDYNFTDK